MSRNVYQVLPQMILRDFKLTRKIETIHRSQPPFIKTETKKTPNIVSRSFT